MTPIVEALQALKGVGLIVAVALAAEIGDFMVWHPRRQMVYPFLVAGDLLKRLINPTGQITKSGNITLGLAPIRGSGATATAKNGSVVRDAFARSTTGYERHSLQVTGQIASPLSRERQTHPK
ncbi:hypothetical protein [Phyllobacterium endophyticum]|uniref:hypothetical protein n=1 Tax=Phyllobacterium endophyticum TaxID=1149773 RepID=UPI0011D6ED96|nr:hypothetical protein [Phyllobacterium endophyticum]TXR50550.1 IS110 family transposase [Phyllobacterium endophyticum]